MHQEIDQSSVYDSKLIDEILTIDNINIMSAEICGSTKIVEFQICRVLLARYMLVNDIRHVTTLVGLPRSFVYWVWSRAEEVKIILPYPNRRWLIQWEDEEIGGLGTLMDAMSISGRAIRYTTKYRKSQPDIRYENSDPSNLIYRWDLNYANELVEYRPERSPKTYKIPKIIVNFGNSQNISVA